MLLSYSCFAQNPCLLVPIEPETWVTAEAKEWMSQMQAWIELYCIRFPLHELLPDTEQRKLEGNPSSPFDAAFRFLFNPPASEQISNEFHLPVLNPHKTTRVVLGMLHCPSCVDMKTTVHAFFNNAKQQYPQVTEVRILAFQSSPLQLEHSSEHRLPQMGVEVFPVNSTVIATDSPVCFFAQFVFKDIAKRICLQHLEVVTQAEAVIAAIKKLGGGKPKDGSNAAAAAQTSITNQVSFQSSSLDHFPVDSFPELLQLVTTNTFPGDVLQVASFGNFATPAMRKEHQKLCARLEVWIGKHLLLAGLAKPSILWLEHATQSCKQEQEFVWESIAWETLQASRVMIGDFQVNNKSLLALTQRPAPRVVAQLVAFQSILLAYAKHDACPLEEVMATLREARKAVQSDNALGFAYYHQEICLWKALRKHRLRLFAEIEQRKCVSKLSLFDELLAGEEFALTKYERKLVLERAVGSAGPGEQPLRFAFPLLQAWSAEPEKQAALADLMLQANNAVSLPHCTCPFVCAVRCVSLPNVTWEQTAADEHIAAAVTAATASVFVFDPFAKKPTVNVTASGAGETVWGVGEENFLELDLSNFLPFTVAVSYQIGANSKIAQLELTGKGKRTVRLGPYRSELAFDAKLTVGVLGARFDIELPRAQHVHTLPLLVREVNGKVCNVSKSIAYLKDGEVAIAPGESVSTLPASTVKYYSRMDFPRFARRLLPVVPILQSIKLSSCELREHVEFSTSSVALVNMQLPVDTKSFTVSAQDQVLFSVTEGDAKNNVKEIRLPLPHNCSFSSLEMRCNDHVGAVYLQPVQVLSTAPPKWISNTRIQVSKSSVAPLDFSKVEVEWDRTTASDDEKDTVRVWFDCEVFDAKTLQPCNSVAWSGVKHWEAKSLRGKHALWVSFLECGDFIVVWSATTLLRVRWWLQSQRVKVG